MKLYDAHSHLHFPENADILAELGKNRNVIVCDCAVSMGDMEDLRNAASLRRDIMRTAYGIHPLYIPSHGRDFPAEALKEFLADSDAVGEIGLDKKAAADFETQKACFICQLELARELNLPAVIHCRGAWRDMFEILKANPLPRGVLVHAANCSPEIVRELLPLGVVFSFGMRELGGVHGLYCASAVPIEKIMVESDADSNAGLLEETLSALALLKTETLEGMSLVVEENFLRFFDKK